MMLVRKFGKESKMGEIVNVSVIMALVIVHEGLGLLIARDAY